MNTTKRILVIEDEAAVRQNLMELLELQDFAVFSAQDGKAGLEVAQTEIPDLILCDVMMPELDGYGVLVALRQNSTTAAIPFIFLTAKASKLERQRGLTLGADDYLTKPFTINEVLRAITSCLEKQVHTLISKLSKS
jgi:two-component system, sensor histidine kinase and response regulator